MESSLGLRCPRCRDPFSLPPDEAWVCIGCGSRYPIVEGIPDFRVSEGPFISNADDRAKAQVLGKLGRTGTRFRDLVDAYYAMTPEVPSADARRFRSAILAGEGLAGVLLNSWGIPRASDRSLLDIGCGTGPLLVAATKRGASAQGVDVALRWLVVARARLEESGIACPLICANAEALPWNDSSFGTVTFVSALEHMPRHDAVMTEAVRVLTGGGIVHVYTPNRGSLGPDPHTGILAGSRLPASVIARISRRRHALPPVRRLLNAGELQRLMARHGLMPLGLTPGPAPPGQGAGGAGLLRRLGIGIYSRLASLPGLRWILLRCGPLLSASARLPAPREPSEIHARP